jgi:hypothetical protein
VVVAYCDLNCPPGRVWSLRLCTARGWVAARTLPLCFVTFLEWQSCPCVATLHGQNGGGNQGCKLHEPMPVHLPKCRNARARTKCACMCGAHCAPLKHPCALGTCACTNGNACTSNFYEKMFQDPERKDFFEKVLRLLSGSPKKK